jgi:hypothetical protein
MRNFSRFLVCVVAVRKFKKFSWILRTRQEKITFEKFPYLFTILTPLQYTKIVVQCFWWRGSGSNILVNANLDPAFFNADMDPDLDPEI